jgi:carbonic anhydrase
MSLFTASSILFTSCVSSDTSKPAVSESPTETMKTIDAPQWSYEGETAPEFWSTLHEDFATCSEGKEQSPINFDTSNIEANSSLKKIQVNYEPSLFTLAHNGHSIELSPEENSKNTITVEGVESRLLQFHFHTPSEHQLNGEHSDMELHLVHQDAANHLTVLGVMVNTGSEQTTLNEIWSLLPEQQTEVALKLTQKIDVNELLPSSLSTFRYDGSFTTPPCTQNVNWVMLKQPKEFKASHINAIQQITPGSNRPTQAWNDRIIQTDAP